MPEPGGMNVAFQVEALTNSEGAREIVKVECADSGRGKRWA
jgi:hypothetical protein